ncbi:MAG: hypothetical protein MUP90_09570 [Gammaproteobacteria bacterium]|nr:hypothetical protein [Gammaproteobacteria bacterium]
MSSKSNTVWLPRVLFESALITASILLALALDEWRDERQTAEAIEQAMSNFLSEIRQNKARVDDAAPFNQGLRNVLSQRYRAGDIGTVDDFIGIVESYNPVVLQSTAWDTALATGSVAKMDYNLVSALSFTYGLQNRYLQTTRNAMSDLTSPQNLSVERLDLAIYNSVRYLEDVTSMETELIVVFGEAEKSIQEAWIDMKQATPEEAQAWAAVPTHD